LSYPAPFYPQLSDEVIYYVRPAGDDSNSGLSAGAAFLTYDRALAALRREAFGRSQIIDISTMAIAEANQKVIPSPPTGINWDLNASAPAPDNFFYRTKFQLRASPILDTAITINNVAADAVTSLMTLTVDEVLVPSAHIGQFVIGDSIAEYGVVVSNTAADIFVAAPAGTIPLGAAGIYGPGATMTFGDAANIFQQALYMLPMSDVTFQGIGFGSTASSKAASLTIYPRFPVNLLLCSFEGLSFEQGGGNVTMDACYIHDKNWGQNGTPVMVRGCFFDGITFNVHGDGAVGFGGFNGCVFDGCSPVFGGNFETRASVNLTDCEVRNATSQGVLARVMGGNITDTRIDNSAAQGILCDRPVYLRMNNVVGTGNGTYGISILNGAQVQDVGVNTITGVTNDIELGAGNGVTWAAMPATAAAEFVRVF
jgi:hypothetical protein